MPRGPLPKATRRRTNAPTIPTSVLPAEGLSRPAPAVPKTYKFGTAAKAWWKWAWSTPQAAAWSDGDLYALARRASLEDDLVAVALVESFDLADYLDVDDSAAVQRLGEVMRRLKALAGGRLAVMKEMDALDIQFGLTAKGMAQLRWTITADEPVPEVNDADLPERWRRAASE